MRQPGDPSCLPFYILMCIRMLHICQYLMKSSAFPLLISYRYATSMLWLTYAIDPQHNPPWIHGCQDESSTRAL